MVVCDKQIDISLRTLDYFFFFPPHTIGSLALWQSPMECLLSASPLY